MNIPTGYQIVPIDPAAMSRAELEEAALLQQALMRERVPEDPPTPTEVITKRMTAVVPGQWRALFAARDRAGAAAGFVFVGRSLNEPENAHVRWTEIGVLPEHRRHGVGRALYRAAVEVCLDQGTDLVFMGMTSDRVADGTHFAEAIGASAGLVMKTNQLDLAAVHRATVAEWASLDPAGYRLESSDDVVPDRLVQPYIDAANSMNDMPKGTMRFNDERMTEAQLRERESWRKQTGVRSRLIVAVDDATGEGAGFTEVTYDPKVPHLIWQQGTGVVAKHRGHKLGLWMKAVMLERILREWTEAKYVRTGNANENQWMLAINTQLGFRHAWSNTMWQLPVAEARASLGLRDEARV